MHRDSQDASPSKKSGDHSDERRGFLGSLASTVMAGGLVGGYGMFAAHAGRFLFPAGQESGVWQFVATLAQMTVGSSMPYRTPGGAKIVVARQSDGETAEDFIALSSICPHLGCLVHWESQNDRFFCPCHNGAFDAKGKATEGPPADANQELKRYPLKVESGLVFIFVPTDTISSPQEA